LKSLVTTIKIEKTKLLTSVCNDVYIASCDCMLCAVEVKKDIAGLLRSVPDLDDMFNIIDKIGAGKLQTSVIYFSDFS